VLSVCNLILTGERSLNFDQVPYSKLLDLDIPHLQDDETLLVSQSTVSATKEADEQSEIKIKLLLDRYMRKSNRELCCPDTPCVVM
jgi:hypothetical protein